MEIGIIVFCLLIALGIIFEFLYIYLKKRVYQNSDKIKALVLLNGSMKFQDVKSSFSISKHYDNKGNYAKVEPVFLMSAELRNNIAYYSSVISGVETNRLLLGEYREKVEQIKSNEHTPREKCQELKIPYFLFTWIEKNLFNSVISKPVVDTVFDVKMTYSSPKGKVKLEKQGHFDFTTMNNCLQSVARSRLDYKTYKQLSLVERSEVSDELRYEILQRDCFKCVICGASASEGVHLHVDHIVPIAKGGKSVPENLRTLCERCNIGKSDKIEIPGAPARPNTLSPDPDIPVCPACGSKLVLRKGKYGSFYGCSAYPKCKYTSHQ